MINKDLIKYDRNNPNSNNSLYALYVQVRLDFNQLYSIIYIQVNISGLKLLFSPA